MKYSIKFYPEKRKNVIENVPLMLSVTFVKLRMFFYTGLRCDIIQWKAEKGEAGKLKRNQITHDGKTSTVFNAELTKISGYVDDLFKGYDVADKAPTPDQLRNDLKRKLGIEIKVIDKHDFFSRFDQFIRDIAVSDNRKKSLRQVEKKIKAFNPDTTFQNLDLPAFQKFLLSKGLGNNSITNYLNCLKTFIKHANEKEYTNINPFISFKFDAEKYGTPIYLTIQERDLLFNAKLEGHYEVVRDIFVFQCLIGCRYGDLLRFKHTNIVDGFIQYIASKTKEGKTQIARIPLSDKAKLILSKYDLPDGRLLPELSVLCCNRKLKKVFEKVGLVRIVTIKDKKTLIDKQVSINTLASTHMARRIFIGGLYNNNVKNEIIASMSGHVAHSKAFSRYYEIKPEQQIEAMKFIN